KFCVRPEEWFRTKARVGGTKQVHLDRVRALDPDLIIANKEENMREDIEALAQEFPVWVSDVRDLDQALDMIDQVGALTGMQDRATQLVGDITAAFDDLEPLEPSLSVAYLIWRDPWMAAGRDTFIDDMLHRCGLQNVFAEGGTRYPSISPAELAAADPDVVLLSSEPYPFGEKHLQEIGLLLPGTPVRMVDGEAFSWYGSRLIQAPAILRDLLKDLDPLRPMDTA
ncbi:MAG: ABC transporter substrate-binding protein, partial [Flavobacteriales bacterium]|nr:ABC transporter substrate-binding protein [Flavobacteriales bacterium]